MDALKHDHVATVVPCLLHHLHVPSVMPVSDTRRNQLIKRRFSSSSLYTEQLGSSKKPEVPVRRLRTSSSAAAYSHIHPFTRSDEEFLETRSDGYYPLDTWHSFQRKMTYASLPPSPIHSPGSLSDHDGGAFTLHRRERPSLLPPIEAPFSLWDYLREEMFATDFDSHQELKWERVSNFMAIPLAIEKVRLLKM